MFRLLSYLTFVPICWIAIVNIFVVKKALAGEADVRWYHAFKWLGEVALIFPVANMVFATIPVLFCSVKLFFTEHFQYVIAAKPECPPTPPPRFASDVV